MINLEGIRLIVADMDGTLLTDKKELDKNMYRVIKELEKKNIQFTLASGRNVHILHSYIEELQISLPYIVNNGANVFQNKLCIYEKLMEKEDLKFAFQILKEEQIAWIAYSHDAVYVSEEESADVEAFMQRLKGKTKQYRGQDIEEILPHNIFKVVISSDKVEQMKILMQCINSHCKTLRCVRSEDRVYTITHVDATKGKTLEKLMDMVDVAPEEVLVFGDNFNDLSMFETVKFSVAMENSVPEVKEKASYCTLTNNDYGVSSFIHTHILKTRG